MTLRKDLIKFKTDILDAISPTFCAAKWYKSTIWLNNGTTASCCHCTRHKIDQTALTLNPKALHNTKFKIANRQNLLNNIKDDDCRYCWDHEKLGKEIISDRVLFSIWYSDEEIIECENDLQNAQLKTAEIAFDSNCNFACMYCDASFSTKWQSDIKRDGPYKNLKSEGRMTYMHDGSWSSPYGLKNINNPYVAAFWKWWETDLHKDINELRITGGEPTMSPDFWKLMDWFQINEAKHIDLAINTNLGIKNGVLDKILEVVKHVKIFRLYTSNESFGAHAEYIRDGLIWDEWVSNIEYLLIMMPENMSLRCMMTVNVLSIFSITEFFDSLIKIRNKLLNDRHISTFLISVNLLKTAEFFKYDILPISILSKINIKLKEWIKNNTAQLHESEVFQLDRLIQAIQNTIEQNDQSEKMKIHQSDFKTFIQQYDSRRGKNLNHSFKDVPELLEWLDSISVEDN